MPTPATPEPSRQRVSAAERRDALVRAAVYEFAQGGLTGTPVDRIARAVGVAQPYVFSLFPTKRDLFLAAVERSFEHTAKLFERAAAEYDAGRSPRDVADKLEAMAWAYHEMLENEGDRAWLMIQHQAFAACYDNEVRARVRDLFADLILRAQLLSGADAERIDEFLRYGMSLNVAAAIGVEALSVDSDWIAARRNATTAGRRDA
ncbi:MAG TPA: TetR/AcrR family transcriptional regulator [Solirubrobacteraceae bacterium]|nr:TetR/AcrR family transcriptional regulator [Solirubrobacteraceae bacterium]